VKKIARVALASGGAGGGYAWTWANSQERVATVVSAADVGKVGWQSDLGRRYTCVDTSDVVWGEEDDRKWGYERSVYFTNTAWLDTGIFMWPGGTVVAGQSSVAPTNRAESVKHGYMAPANAGFCTTGTEGLRNIGNRAAYGIRYRGMTLQRASGDGAAAYAWWFGISGANLGSIVSEPPVNSFVVGRIKGSSNIVVRTVGGLTSQVQDIDLGANFPGSLLGEGYDIETYSLNGTAYAYSVIRVNTGHAASGVVSSGFLPIPSAIAYGGFYANTTAPAVAYSYMRRWSRAGGGR